MQHSASLAVVFGLASFVLADPHIPYYPNITNPDFPLGSRCIDYCAFLKPGQICPGRTADVSCLCEVYNCEQCWADKNSTVANDLLAVESFCSSFIATASISGTASGATAAPTTTGSSTLATKTSGTASQTGSATTSPAVQKTSGASSSSGMSVAGLWVAGLVTVGAVLSLL